MPSHATDGKIEIIQFHIVFKAAFEGVVVFALADFPFFNFAIDCRKIFFFFTFLSVNRLKKIVGDLTLCRS